MQEHVIIVAGGQGLRMGGEIPKQFLPLKGLPVLMHTINQFVKYNNQITVILVLPAMQKDYWTELCSQYNFTVPTIWLRAEKPDFTVFLMV
jgi:2-C-methyl-D-erythritol 4-phosphate cytidylyltransferase